MVQTKLDLKKSDPNYYKVGLNPDIRQLPSVNYLSIAGQSSPEDPKFTEAIQTIYSVAYAIKFINKGEDKDFVVPKMECFWFVKGNEKAQHLFPEIPRDEWCWKILIRQPDFVTEEHYRRSLHICTLKNVDVPFSKIAFETMDKGDFAQILHIGSYDAEEESISKLHNHITRSNFQIDGYHKEIYLSDPRKTAQDKLRTIIQYRIKEKK